MGDKIFYKELVDRYTSKKISDDELTVFFGLVSEGKLQEELGNSFMAGTDIVEPQIIPVKVKYRSLIRIAAAACIIGIISFGIFLITERPGVDDRLRASAYRTITTSRGEQQMVTLPDGSQIWLNAASTLRFPVAFTNDKRIVKLEGEGYFEVRHNASVPFIVQVKNDLSINVLGTRFNVHGYQNEPVKTTLIDGSIRVESHRQTAILKPGQEATLKDNGELNILSSENTGQSTAWKNGLFEFDRADITTVMGEIERWYDVQVIYKGEKTNKQFVGKMPKSSTLSEVLDILELNGIHVRKEGNNLVVTP